MDRKALGEAALSERLEIVRVDDGEDILNREEEMSGVLIELR